MKIVNADILINMSKTLGDIETAFLGHVVASNLEIGNVGQRLLIIEIDEPIKFGKQQIPYVAAVERQGRIGEVFIVCDDSKKPMAFITRETDQLGIPVQDSAGFVQTAYRPFNGEFVIDAIMKLPSLCLELKYE